MAPRLWEELKNLVIVLLLCSIVCLVLLALPSSTVAELPLPDRLTEFLGIQQTEEPQQQPLNQEVTAAAAPLLISIHHTGGRRTIRQDTAELDATYDSLTAFFGQALSSATNPQPITQEDFVSAMSLPGILFSFGGKIPAQALSRWLGGRDSRITQSATDYLLVREEHLVSLLLLGDEPVRYSTAVTPDGLQAAAESYTPDGSQYAFEKGSRLHPLSLWETAVTLPAYSVTNPVTAGFATQLATALDLNPYGAGTYTDPSGNTVFTENNWALSVSAEGTVVISVTGDDVSRFTAAENSPAAKIELVRSVLDTITQGTLGDQRLQLQSYEGDSCTFTYVLGGIPVAPAVSYATFREQQLTELSITLRTYYLTNGQHRLMSSETAQSIAEEGDRLSLAYSAAAACGWTAG